MTSMTPHQTVLLVEDEPELAKLTSSYLCKNGYHVDLAENGIDAERMILESHPDLVILDIMLPGKDGLDVCKDVRDRYHNPILMLTARSDDIDQILGLELGADDYLCKPVSPRLLLAHVKALLRRQPHEPQSKTPALNTETLEFSNLRIDNRHRSVFLNGNEIDLSTPEYDTLWHLASHAGRIVSRADIFKEVRGFEYDGLSRFVDITVSYLRQKLGDDPNHPERIKTIRSKGYLFTD